MADGVVHGYGGRHQYLVPRILGFVAPCPLALRSEGLWAAEAWASSAYAVEGLTLLTGPGNDCSLTQKTDCALLNKEEVTHPGLRQREETQIQKGPLLRLLPNSLTKPIKLPGACSFNSPLFQLGISPRRDFLFFPLFILN